MAGKEKEKELEGDQNTLKSNNNNYDHPDGTATNNTSPKRDFLQPLMVNICLKPDSEMTQFDTELGLSEDVDKGMLQNKRHISSEYNENNNDDLHVGVTRPSLDEHDMGRIGNLDVNSVSEAAECDDDESSNHSSVIIKMYDRKEQDNKKRRKVLDPSVNMLESNEDGDGSSLQVVHDRRLNNSSDSSDEALESGCSEIVLEREEVAVNDNSMDVAEDILVEKHLGGCSDLEHASGKMETFEQAKRPLLIPNQNAVFGVNSSKQLDASGSDPHSVDLDQKEQSKIGDAIPSSLDLYTLGESSTQVKDQENLPPESSKAQGLTGSFRKKLLVLDVNGLLTDIVSDVPDGYEADTIIGRKAVFKRPYCDDFLQFCFERFNVGVWSSRTKRNVESVLDFIMGRTCQNLLFCWDQSHCTETGFNTVENRDKPLLLKELKKLWEKHEVNLPWEKGDYNESNTLLLDDSPYKALRNPPNTAIFPHTYRYKDRKDNSLGPGGDLRVYLEGLSLAENVQKYVEKNPYGQRPITKSNLSWHFYLKVIGTTSTQPEDYSNKSNLDHASGESKMKIETKMSKETIDEDPFAKHGASSKDIELEIFEKAKRARIDTNQKRQSKMEFTISSLSNSVASKGNVQMINQENHHPTLVFQSSLGRALPVCSRRKLLVLDVNGILADIVPLVCDGYDGYKADTTIGRKAVFKRPFCDDFLQFCFERFSVGVWSSGPKGQVQLLLDFLMQKTRHNLLFCWDYSHCTYTGFTTVENRDRDLLLKELRKLWDKHDPNLPWQRGEYNESNTLLLDIAPHKALRNPPNTAIFPHSYRYTHQNDNSLGPEGDLRVYLEGLASAENVQKYVEQNPFGQRPITHKNLSWRYYLKVIGINPYGDANISPAASSQHYARN
ncbi:hypothetical protein LguiA_009413 [Lonicera macranthoides]